MKKEFMEAKDLKSDSKRMQKAFYLAMTEIENVLDRTKAITDLTRMAAGVVNSYSRIKSTEIHDKALELLITRKGGSGSSNLPQIGP
jgi:uncharacterized protein YejL (UPF0352 family)